MHRDRLLLLASYLEDSVPPGHFNMGGWVRGQWDTRGLRGEGVTACALGWATEVPELKALGLRLEKVPSNEYSDERYLQGAVTFPGVSNEIDENAFYGYNVSIVSAQLCFGLDELQARFLFVGAKLIGYDWRGPGDDETDPKAMADHIRRFLEKAQ
jgi:hypothetical protein